MPDANNEPVSLEGIGRGAPTVVVFSRGAWCPFCVAHLKALAASHERFKEAGVRVVSISTDTPPRSIISRAITRLELGDVSVRL